MLEKFEGLIGRLTRSVVINNIVDQEDLKQELRLKLVQIMPSLSEIPEEEIFCVV